jgi:hypothetical protein
MHKRTTFSNNGIQGFFEAHHCGSLADYNSYHDDKIIALNTFAHNGKNNDGIYISYIYYYTMNYFSVLPN